MNRKLLKENAKLALKQNFWLVMLVVLVAQFLGVADIGVASSGGGSYSGSSSYEDGNWDFDDFNDEEKGIVAAVAALSVAVIIVIVLVVFVFAAAMAAFSFFKTLGLTRHSGEKPIRSPLPLFCRAFITRAWLAGSLNCKRALCICFSSISQGT